MIRVPFCSRGDKLRALQDVLDATARDTGYSSYEVARLMSFFIENVADEVTRGHVIRLPGFGLFGPWLDQRKWVLARWHPIHPVCRPVFVASRGFRQQVRYGSLPDPAAKQAIERARRNHSIGSRPDKQHSRVFTAQAAFRAQIERQMGR